MQSDKILIEILPDGTIKSTTDEVSGPNHQSAEDFLKMISRLAGGETVRVRRNDVHGHTHTHEHGHEHQH